MRILVLHGPNLNLLGEREPAVYGPATLEEIDARIGERAKHLGSEVRTFQSNHEGALVDRLHAERRWADGVLFNPAALTHYAWSLRDAVAAVSLPCIEVHISDVSKREAWRRVSVLADVRAALCAGRGLDSYLEALELLLEIAPGPERDADGTVELLVERLAHPDERAVLARELAQILRRSGRFRWVGLYDVGKAEVEVLGWAGPGPPAHPKFPRSAGLTGAAIASGRPLIVQDVRTDGRHLPMLEGTRAEAIFPVGPSGVLGAVDVESANAQAFTVERVRWLERCVEALAPFWASGGASR
ncbi:MAG TPA: type II 3-dehydroquinate dehydratase [Myxococcaceae bacterium]|jgi:3-dehydroquinate dehydratase-2